MANVDMQTALDLWHSAELLVKAAQKVLDAKSVEDMETALFEVHFDSRMMMQDIGQRRLDHSKTGV